MKFLVINGPNLNMLGVREPQIYGSNTYRDLVEYVSDFCAQRGVETEFVQSNHEGDLVDAIQRAYFDKVDGIIINPAAYTHTSVALLDALKSVQTPAVEVHLSKVEEREDFRQISYLRPACIRTITGHGFAGYSMAAVALLDYLSGR